MESRLVETLIGAAVLAIAGLFFAFAYSSADVQTDNGYNVMARFDNAGGITPGTDVRLSGIKVGTVTAVALNPRTYRAEVSLNITGEVELPDDSSIKVTSDGLLGGSYLAIEPGGGLDYLEDGGEIAYTQGSVDLMSLIGQAVFAFTEGDGSSGEDAAAAPTAEVAPVPASSNPVSNDNEAASEEVETPAADEGEAPAANDNDAASEEAEAPAAPADAAPATDTP